MLKKHFLRGAAMALAMVLLCTSSAFALTLRYSQQSDDVADLQRALKQLGYYTKTIDGTYGSGTLSAVKRFQKANGLTADGVAGPLTLAKLEALTGIEIGGGSGSTGSGSTGSGSTGGSGSGTVETPSAGSGLFSGVYTTLEYGDKGDRVKILQQALKDLGYDISKVDGVFGTGTKAAVKAFQTRHSLTADGKAGKKTLQKVETYFDKDGSLIGGPIVSNPPAEGGDADYDVPTRTLRYGMSGADVTYTQQRLYTLKYYTGARDGKFGSGLLSAVKAFQKKNGLAADGVVGPATIKVLFSSDALAADDPTEEATPTPSPTPTATPSPTPGATPSRTLRYGDSGEDVKLIQNRLIALNYLSGTASGVFDSTTLTAVRAFQKAHALTVDGVAGTNTYKKLFSDSAIPAASTPTPSPSPTSGATPSRTLRYGYTGEDVKLLQNRLIELGYLKGTADGTFGTTTQTAVKAFQKANGLTVDGVAGTNTYKKLFSDSAIEAIPEEEELIPTRTLTIGDSGDDVKSVQRRLKALSYLTGTADGQYGATTAAAMKAFQQMNGLTASGEGNLATYARLYSDDALTALGVKEGESASSYITLRSGATGAAVIRLQQKLAELDYDVQVTGTYDSQTLQAVRSFQMLNGLSVDGVAGKNTQTKLYSGTAKRFPTGPDGAIYGSMGYVAAPAKSQIKLLHWANDIKNTVAYGDALLAYDPATGISWSLTIIARGRHCDVEPSTKADTAAMNAAFGNKVTWTPKPVYIRLPSGTWTVATTHNVPHGVNPIADNDFEGQNCVHFLRDMSETEKNDPDYGVTNQKALRQFWYELTGQTIAYK
ncbi:MAG: peptidoglycan-binding protein [Aristaeellaceae bacterium]